MTTLPTGAPGSADRFDRRGSGADLRGLRRRWIVRVTAGEFVGFALTAAAASAVQLAAPVALRLARSGQ